jgi:hypothetical protein
VEDATASKRLEVFPNPVSDVLTVRWKSSTDDEMYTIRFFDSGGRLLYQKPCQVSSGYCSVETGKLAPGTYIISISGNNFSSRQLINKIN